MHRSNDTSTYADTGSTARCLNAAASYISIPQCTGLKSEILLSGTTERFVSLLHEISKFTNIRPLLQGNETAADVFKQALQQWFSELIPESVQKIVSFSPIFFTEPNSNDYADCNFGTKEGDYMLLFQFDLLHLDGFALIDSLRYYETLCPGLGQNILCKIESVSPFRIGTPRDLLNFVQDNIWGCNETEDGYIEDMISCDDYTNEEEKAEYIEMYRDEMVIIRKDFDRIFEPWMLNPQETKIHQSQMPEELQELFALPDRKFTYTHELCSYENFPGIVLAYNDTIYDALESVYHDFLNSSMETFFGAIYWIFPEDEENLYATFLEMESTLRSYGKLLEIIHNIHLYGEEHGYIVPKSEKTAA